MYHFQNQNQEFAKSSMIKHQNSLGDREKKKKNRVHDFSTIIFALLNPKPEVFTYIDLPEEDATTGGDNHYLSGPLFDFDGNDQSQTVPAYRQPQPYLVLVLDPSLGT